MKIKEKYWGVVCTFLEGGSQMNVCVGRRVGGKQGKWAVYIYMNNSVCRSFRPPSPKFFTSPLSVLTPSPLLFLSAPHPSTSRLYNTFQISACLQPPGRGASLLMEFGS